MEGSFVLALDNSLDFLCIALSRGEDLLEERRIRGRESASQIIGEEVLDLLRKRDISPTDLKLLVSTVGPGSFTGIRVALAFLKGLKIGLGVPLVGVPTLDCLAYQFSFMEGFFILPTIDAKKGETFCALYFSKGKRIERITSYEARKPEDVRGMIKKPCIILGSGVKVLRDFLDDPDFVIARTSSPCVPMDILIKLGLERLTSFETNVLPVYGRRSEAEIKFDVYLT